MQCFRDFVLERSGAFDKCSTQVNLSRKDAVPILKYIKSIPDEDLYLGEEGSDSYGPSYGREKESHITCLYGLLPKVKAKDVQEVLNELGLEKIEATLKKVSLFQNDDKPYDVVKIDVKSPDLKKVNSALQELPFKSDFSDYHPHLTLAYVKKGMGKKYKGDDRFDGKVLTFDKVLYSSTTGKKTPIKLK